MKRATKVFTAAAIVAAAASALLLSGRNLAGYVISNWWNDSTNIVMDDVFLPAATWSNPAQFQLSEWNEVDTTDKSHPFRISSSPEFSFGEAREEQPREDGWLPSRRPIALRQRWQATMQPS